MFYTEFASLVREYTKTNSGSFSDDRMVVFANGALETLAGKIAEVDENLFELSTDINLLLNTRKYALDADLSKFLSDISRVEMKIDGKYKKIEEIDFNSLPCSVTDESEIIYYFGGQDVRYAVTDGFIWIFSEFAIAAVTAGIKMYFSIFPQKFTTSLLGTTADISKPISATAKGLPRRFHELLARRVSIDYKGTRDVPMPLSKKEAEWDQDFEEALNSMRMANVGSFQELSNYNDGSQY